MNSTAQACLDFEQDINLFVDHDIPEDSARRLVTHLDDCTGCRAYVDDLRQLSVLARRSAADADEARAALVDRHVLFAGLTASLLDEKRSQLARLFYELGKAYMLAANAAEDDDRQRSVLPMRPPVDIRGATGRGRRLAREAEDLERAGEFPRSGARHTGGARETGSLFAGSRRLFSSSARAGKGALTNGRRLLEEALALDPALDEARLYLGFHHMLSGRLDRARLVYREAARTAAEPVHRMMALQMLGNVHAAAGDYDRAIECYQRVVDSGLLDSEPRLFTALVNLAVNCVKVGCVERAVDHFRDLVRRYPARVDQARCLIRRKRGFSDLLRRQSRLADDLRRQVPVLFAA